MNARLAAGIALVATLSLIGCTKPVKTATCTGTTKATASGACVECLTTADCASNTYCDATGSCASCTANPTACTSGTDGGTDGGPSGCRADTDCTKGQYCSSGTCLAGCSTDAECGTGKICEANACVLGCKVAATSACVTSLQCCPSASGATTGVCTDIKTNAAKNCGGCGNPACATGDACCGGTCIDTQTDPNNCGACKKACGGSVKCVAGQCQDETGILALFDASGSINVAGVKTPIQVLKPLAYVQTGPANTNVQSLLSCKGYYFDGTTSAPASANAGTIKMTGYAGGTLVDSVVAPSEIDCLFNAGSYQCGYGAPTGTPPVPGAAPGQVSYPAATDAFGANAMITFSAPGGGGTADFGSFSSTVAAAPSFPVQEDLSSLTYDPNAAAGTTIHLTCPTGAAGCGVGGMVIFIKATPNDSQHYEDSSTNYGYIQCFGSFGTVLGRNLGMPQITVTQAAIKAMLNSGGPSGADATLKTFVTTVGTLDQAQVTPFIQATPMDSLGHKLLMAAGKGSIGVSAPQ